MFYNKKQIHGQQGFTLVEIMVAMLVFMVIMLGVAGGLLLSIRNNKGNVVRDEALRVAEDELNRLKAEQFSVFGISASLAANAPAWAAQTSVPSNIRSGAITFAKATRVSDLGATATQLKRIEVAVGWDDPNNPGGAALPATGKNRQISLSTIIVLRDS